MKIILSKPSLHEERIIELFSGDVFNTNRYPVLNQTLVVLLFTNRCGSNLFASHLKDVFSVGDLGEALNYPEVLKRSTPNDIKSFQEYIYKNALPYSLKQVPYGLKASLQQLAMLARWRAFSLFSKVVIFQVERRDLLAQAISMLIASQTGQWSSKMPSQNAKIEFDFDAISEIARENSYLNATGRLVLQALGFPYEVFEYEQFTNHPRTALVRAAKSLGVPLGDFVVPEPVLKRQASEKNDLLKRLYLDEVRRVLDH